MNRSVFEQVWYPKVWSNAQKTFNKSRKGHLRSFLLYYSPEVPLALPG